MTIRLAGGGPTRVVSKGGGGNGGGAAGRQLFIANLPGATTWQNLREVFANVGKVERADVTSSSGRKAASGIVVMSSEAEASKVIHLPKHLL